MFEGFRDSRADLGDINPYYTYTATVDDLSQVAESNENNNTATSTVP